jgi:hypothetical protein
MKEMASYHSNGIRCAICGRFVAYGALADGTAETEFTPETEYTRERTEFFHRSCVRR